MSALALAAGLVLAARARQELSAPPKAPIAGIAGFGTKSRVHFGSDETHPYKLETYYVFPDRVRWMLIAEGASADQRLLFYRFGESYWTLPRGSETSIPLEGVEWLETCTQMELRRALMLWPDGFEWQGEGDLRMAKAFAPPRGTVFPFLGADYDPGPMFLVAKLNDQGRPRELRIESGNVEHASCRDVTWQERGGRWWPASMTIEQPAPISPWLGQEPCHETIDVVDTRLEALDHFFLPPDRMEREPLTSLGEVYEVVVPPSVVRREPLRARETWEATLSECARLRAEEARRLAGSGLTLETAVVVELDGQGRPTACLLRLVGEPEVLPEGWSRTPERAAITLARADREPVTASLLEVLRERIPRGGSPETPYVRLSLGHAGTTISQVVLPFQRSQ